MAVASWREYQEAAAEVFRSFGMAAETDKAVKGARATHNVDVVVGFDLYGMPQMWLVECKDWKTRVTKEKVLAFLALVQDVGAVRGFVLCEEGFQSGAKQAAEHTNVTLTDLTSLRESAAEDLVIERSKQMRSEIGQLRHRLEGVSGPTRFERDPAAEAGGATWSPEPSYYATSGRLHTLTIALDEVDSEGFPVAYELGPEIVWANDLPELVKGIEKVLSEVEGWVEERETQM